MRSRRAFRIGAVLVAVVAAVGLAGPAQAATNDGKSAKSTGCATTAKTVATATMRSPYDNSKFGTIELIYSTSCRTTWARITSVHPIQSSSPSQRDWNDAWATITRNSDGKHYSCQVAVGQTSCVTAMVNDAGVSSFASGWGDDGEYMGIEARTKNY